MSVKYWPFPNRASFELNASKDGLTARSAGMEQRPGATGRFWGISGGTQVDDSEPETPAIGRIDLRIPEFGKRVRPVVRIRGAPAGRAGPVTTGPTARTVNVTSTIPKL
jgi:hypothetical protein